jgi:uncharacterized protein
VPPVTALILADTHVPRFRPELPPELGSYLDACDIILHAGDVTDPGVLERLETTIAGVEVAMVHDSGPSRGRPARLARWFPRAELIVYGHSHIPSVVRDGPRLLVNPGSPTWKRRQPHPTAALARLEPGGVSATLIELA